MKSPNINPQLNCFPPKMHKLIRNFQLCFQIFELFSLNAQEFSIKPNKSKQTNTKIQFPNFYPPKPNIGTDSVQQTN